MQHPTFHELPDILTIDEVATFLRISRALAYELARRYRETGGREGLPVIEAGSRLMRVYKIELAKFLAGEFGHDNRAAS